MMAEITRVGRVFRTWEIALIGLLFLEIFLFGSFNRAFLNVSNLLYSTSDFVHIILGALPLTFVIITGGIDISIASTMGLASIVLGVTWQSGVPLPVAVGIALVVGLIAGVLNGTLVAFTDIHPLVITLGTMFLYGGVSTGIAGSLGASGYKGISGYPEGFMVIAHGSVGPIPSSFIIALGYALLLYVVLIHTRLGRAYYLIGVNEPAAKYTGVSVRLVKISAYAFTGLGAAIAGVILTSYFTSSRSDLGSEALLPAVTAVVLGGASILGGKGNVTGTLLAAIFVGVLRQGLMALGVTSDVSQVMVGLLLIITVALKYLWGQSVEYRRNRKILAGT